MRRRPTWIEPYASANEKQRINAHSLWRHTLAESPKEARQNSGAVQFTETISGECSHGETWRWRVHAILRDPTMYVLVFHAVGDHSMTSSNTAKHDSLCPSVFQVSLYEHRGQASEAVQCSSIPNLVIVIQSLHCNKWPLSQKLERPCQKKYITNVQNTS